MRRRSKTCPCRSRGVATRRDPADIPNSTKHRVNDISLKVIAPNDDVYWGNHGLLVSNWSLEGGSEPNEDHINTVENVFIEEPAQGTYIVKVLLTELNADGNPATPEDPNAPDLAWDAVFSLVASGVVNELPSRGGDWNGDGVVDARDYFDFLHDFVQARADVDGSGMTDAADFFQFLADFLSVRMPYGGRAHRGRPQ